MPRLRRARRASLERPLVPVLLALSMALAGCLGGAGGEPEPNAQGSPADRTVPDGREPAPTVVDMSGQLLAPSAGIFGIGNAFEVGTVPSGEDDRATILLDFRPDLGPAALSVSICIAAEIVGAHVDCEAWEYSTGEAVQLDATGLSGKTIFIRTDYGVGSGTVYVLCASVFDFHPAPGGYTAIAGGHCHVPAAHDAVKDIIFACDVVAGAPFVTYGSDPGFGGCGFATLDAPHVFLAYGGPATCEAHHGTDGHALVSEGTLEEGARYEAGTRLWANCELGVVEETLSLTFAPADEEA